MLTKMQMQRGRLLALAFAVILLWQLVLPGFIGLADNGDFGKVAGRFCIGAGEEGAQTFVRIKPVYTRREANCWVSGIPSSEAALVWVASSVEELAADRNKFDIRWIGVLHAVGFLFAFCLWVRTLRPLDGFRWIAAAGLLLLVFTDVGYVSYANSFYTDVAALLGAMALVPAALFLMQPPEPRPRMLILFGAAALLFITSKGQHTFVGLMPIAFLIVVMSLRQKPATRWLAGLVAAGLIVGMALMLVEIPTSYREASRFSLLFYKILPGSTSPAGDAAELGLAPADLALVGTHSFSPNTPMANPQWVADFSTRGGFGDVVKFYLRHPDRLFQILWRDLTVEAGHRRPFNLSNFQGQPKLTTRFGLWSSIRDWMFLKWPWHAVLWYLAVFTGVVVSLFRDRSPLRRAILWAILCAALMGLGEFCIASLTDAVETHRHLLLFHLFTDVTLILAMLYALYPAAALSSPASSQAATPASGN